MGGWVSLNLHLVQIRKIIHNENAGALMRPPATCPLCQYSCPKVVKGCQYVMPSYHDVVLWRHVTNWLCVIHISEICQYSCPKVVKGCQYVMPSYHDVVLWRHVTNWLCVIHISEIVLQVYNFFYTCTQRCAGVIDTSRELYSWAPSGHTHTDGTDFIPSNADAGEKNGPPLTLHSHHYIHEAMGVTIQCHTVLYIFKTGRRVFRPMLSL